MFHIVSVTSAARLNLTKQVALNTLILFQWYSSTLLVSLDSSAAFEKSSLPGLFIPCEGELLVPATDVSSSYRPSTTLGMNMPVWTHLNWSLLSGIWHAQSWWWCRYDYFVTIVLFADWVLAFNLFDHNATIVIPFLYEVTACFIRNLTEALADHFNYLSFTLLNSLHHILLLTKLILRTSSGAVHPRPTCWCPVWVPGQHNTLSTTTVLWLKPNTLCADSCCDF